ncbi:MAG: hypothetical protein K6L75_10915 [Cellvibrionaceae bacterium]
MTKKNSPHRSTNRQTVGIVVSALGVIGAAIMVTLFLRDEFTLSVSGLGAGGSGGYQNITLTDAQISCHELAKSKYGKRLKYISVDGHSSRFEEKDNRFRIYFNMDLYPRMKSEGDKADEFFINCYVHGSRGSVTHFEAIENKESSPGPLGEDQGGLFGS